MMNSITDPPDAGRTYSDDEIKALLEPRDDISVFYHRHHANAIIRQLRRERDHAVAQRDAARAALKTLMSPSMTTREEFRQAWKEAMSGDTVSWEQFTDAEEDER